MRRRSACLRRRGRAPSPARLQWSFHLLRELVRSAAGTAATASLWVPARRVLETGRRMPVFDPQTLDCLRGGIPRLRKRLPRTLAQCCCECVDLGDGRLWHAPIEARKGARVCVVFVATLCRARGSATC